MAFFYCPGILSFIACSGVAHFGLISSLNNTPAILPAFRSRIYFP